MKTVPVRFLSQRNAESSSRSEIQVTESQQITDLDEILRAFFRIFDEAKSRESRLRRTAGRGGEEERRAMATPESQRDVRACCDTSLRECDTRVFCASALDPFALSFLPTITLYHNAIA